MSYDLAVWEGERPADDKTARRTFEDLYERYLGAEIEHAPTSRIAAYVTALWERWCDVTEDVDDSSPWSTGPLMRDTDGPVVYFPMWWDRAEEASACAVVLADSMGGAPVGGYSSGSSGPTSRKTDL
ncbi:hypothetical protein [Streptomyces murinus]|uniref:Uncharacterized protein n=1 Tax=Streptomyces murinus TaxID=33900 RepID=A0A7W3RNX8_STRMR|nr:hypothetical protein [Streptomyces murinus]MBA9056682.1 hypothetical protein [Streptomyces murinus]